MPESYCNGYWTRDKVVLLRRQDDGQLNAREVRAEYSFFLRKADVSKEVYIGAGKQPSTVGQELRRKHCNLKDEGDFVRVLCPSSEFRFQLCRGTTRGTWFDALNIEPLEADVHPVTRYLIDSRCGIQKPRIAFFDLETDSRVPFGRKEDARILCWSITFEDGSRMASLLNEDTDADERDLLVSFYEELHGVDLIAAWNGDRFDFEMLDARCERLRVRVEHRRWLRLDHMLAFKKYNAHSAESGGEKASNALTRVAESLNINTSAMFGQRVAVDASKSWDLWVQGGDAREQLRMRCAADSGLMYEIEKKTGYVNLHYGVSDVCGCFPDGRALNAKVPVEAFVMRLAAERGIRFPSQWEREPSHQFEGAAVVPIVPGMHRSVHVCDFSGMYPSIIESLNLSPETHVPELSGRTGESFEDIAKRLPPNHCVAPRTHQVFRTDVEGVLAIAVATLKGIRKKYKKVKQNSVPNSPEWIEADRLSQGGKIAVNSCFGVASSPYSRLFKREVGESITLTGQELTLATLSHGGVDLKRLRLHELDVKISQRDPASTFHIDVVAGDTDSLLAKGPSEDEFREFVRECNAKVYPAILDACHARLNVIELTYEKEYELLVLVSKKHYAARYAHYEGKRSTNETKPEIKGLEFKRGDTIRLCRDFQEQVVSKLMLVGQTVPRDYPLQPKDFEPMIEEYRDRIVKAELSVRDVVVSKNMSKEIREYQVKMKKDLTPAAQPLHVEVAKVLEARGEDVGAGARIEYVVIDGDAAPLKAIPACDYVPGMEDRHYLWETLTWPATLRVLQAVWPGHRWSKFDESKPRAGGRGQSRYSAGQTHMPFWND